jgi:hypothetical protein
MKGLLVKPSNPCVLEPLLFLTPKDSNFRTGCGGS